MSQKLKYWIIAFGLSLAYLILSYFLIGFKTDQLVLVAIFSFLYLTSPSTRKFIITFSPFIVFWIMFDYMKVIPNYLFHEVHIKDIHDAEVYLFGINVNGTLVTPGDFLNSNHFLFEDILAGIFYLCWIPVPLSFGFYLYFYNRAQTVHFTLTFLVINLVGFVIYYSFPAAPPWYFQLHGNEFIPQTPGNCAGLIRFDEFFNVTIFRDIYAKSSNVFAAMPSLHSAYPSLVLYFSLRNKLRRLNILFIIITMGIWAAAVYANHHYILDVLAGIATAICGIALFRVLFKSNKYFRSFVDRMVEIVS